MIKMKLTARELTCVQLEYVYQARADPEHTIEFAVSFRFNNTRGGRIITDHHAGLGRLAGSQYGIPYQGSTDRRCM